MLKPAKHDFFKLPHKTVVSFRGRGFSFPLIKKRPHAFIGLLLFALCAYVYLMNPQFVIIDDTLPNSLLAFNWLRYGTLNFDAFRANFVDSELPWYFVEAPNGHLTSVYPIGTAIVTFPFYVLFTLYLKIVGLLQTGHFDFPPNLPDIFEGDFNYHRNRYQKLAAAGATALSVVMFYYLVRLRSHPGLALLFAFIFAFATSSWTISSQGVWQHTASNLVLVAAMLCLFKANRTTGYQRRILLVVVGVFCGLLPGIRPTSALFAIALLVYCLFTYRKEAWFVLLGLPSALLAMGWNYYYFGSLVGGYSQLYAQNEFSYSLKNEFSYNFNLPFFWNAFWGLLISPSRGLFIYSPILLFSLPGVVQVYRARAGKDEKLILCLAIACFTIFLQYCFYDPWEASLTYGNRFLTDLLPVLCYLTAYYLTNQWRQMTNGGQLPLQASRRAIAATALVFFLTIYSTSVQAIGAFGNYRSWEVAPYDYWPRLWYSQRLWDWQDTQIARTARSIVYRIAEPIRDEKSYRRQSRGQIINISDEAGRPISQPIVATVFEQKMLRATVRNTGSTPFYGYLTGMDTGELKVRARFLDRNKKQFQFRQFFRRLLHVEGEVHAPGTEAAALGIISFPTKPGKYTLVFDLLLQNIGKVPQPQGRSSYRIPVEVRPDAVD